MKISIIKTFAGLILLFFFVIGAGEALAQSKFRYSVKHDHLRKYCEGELVINDAGIEYVTDKAEHARKWAFVDIQMIKLISTKKMQVLTYEENKLQLGRDREFKFDLVEGEITKEVSDFILSKVKRPVLTTFIETEAQVLFAIPVRHRHRFGGCAGTLKVYANGLVYESENEQENSRYWRWSELQGIARSGQFQFSVTTYEPQFGGPTKQFNFDLKEPINDKVYDYIWDKVFKVQYYPPAVGVKY